MQTLIAFIVAILILVSVHELGHLVVARYFNIKVIRFSIGFGKPFWKKNWKNIEWCIAPIPLGGYVKMVDTREDENIPPEDLPYAFDKQHPLKRIAVVVAGPLVNLVLAIVLFTVTSMFGVTDVKPWVGSVMNYSIAQRAGFQEGDRVLSVNGTPVKDFGELSVQMMLSADMGDVHIQVQNAKNQTVERVIKVQNEKNTLDAIARGQESFGIIPNRMTQTIANINPKGAAYQAGLRNGDKIVMIDDEPYSSWQDIAEKIRHSAGQTLSITYLRDGQGHTVNVLPKSFEEHPDKPLVGKIGTWWASDGNWQSQVVSVRYPNVWEAIALGWKKTVDYSWLTLKFFGRMLIGQASMAHISGPVTIADLAGKTAAAGLQAYVQFLALISLSLGVMNLLPIPVLDGGHFVFYMIEWLRGKPLNQKIQEAGVRLGLAAMLLLMCVAFFNDFTRLFG